MHNSSPNRALPGRTYVATLAAITACAIFSTSVAAHASDTEARRQPDGAPAPAIAAAHDVQRGEVTGLSNAEVEELLELLVAIPDDVLAQGGEAALSHLRATHAEPGGSSRLSLPSAKCIGLVTAAVAGALIPAGKVVKLAMIAKKYGVKRVANALIGVRKGLGKKYPNDLKDAALILLGVDQIKEACK
ncbi:hypothetical protein [Streptomyces formicae]